MGGYTHETRYSYSDVRNPKSEATATEIALMSPKQRAKYHATKEAKLKKAEEAKKIINSPMLNQKTFLLLQHVGSQFDMSYNDTIYEALTCYLCFRKQYLEEKSKYLQQE